MKKLCCFVLTFMLTVSAISAKAATVVFVDVPKDYWAYDTILYFTENNIVNGVGNNKFEPQGKVTREQFAKLLVNTFNAPQKTPDETTFSDVGKDRWSYSSIETAKDFLTGYANPFGGKPIFQPEAAATREDIAVSLVKMMGLTANDLKNNQRLYGLSDYNTISPNIRDYVAIAAERGFITGYPDGTFRPNAPITRAECVTLLSRAMKQATTDLTGDVFVSANVVQNQNEKNQFTLYVEANEGTVVTVDGNSVMMDSVGNGKTKGSVNHIFNAEGSKSFVITATKMGKTKTISATAEYKIGVPVLTFTSCPSSSDTKTVKISGTLVDPSDKNPTLTVNNKTVDFWNGSWSTTVDLTEGSNEFKFVAKNKLGKATTQTKTITFGVGAPVLNITTCPTSSDTKTVNIKGTVSDLNDKNPQVTVNNKVVDVWNGSWSATVNLSEGTNEVKIVATNSLGKTTTQTKTITFGVGAPVLNITACPTSSDTQTVNIKGTVSDLNDKNPQVTVNNKVVDVWNGSWSTTVDLSEGTNEVKIVATNSLGKTTTQTKTITFGVGTPILNITTCPTSSDTKTVGIKGTVSDLNDKNPQVTVNNKVVDVWNGSWSATIDLSEGANEVKIVATNNLGKSTTQTKQILFEVETPSITFFNCPATTSNNEITIEGAVQDKYKNPKLYINDVSKYLSDHQFSMHVTLKQGENTFQFRVVNEYGKEYSVTKTITYQP